VDSETRDKIRKGVLRANSTCPKCGSPDVVFRCGNLFNPSEFIGLKYRECKACGYTIVIPRRRR
jgi:ribosomal protein S27AE